MGGTRGHRVDVGAMVDERTLVTTSGEQVTVPDPDRLVHIQFRRFAGCPFCNLHLRSVARRHGEIAQAGIREVVLFHSSAESLLDRQGEELPFPIIADPEKRLYREFGVESSPLAVLHPRAWPAAVRGLLAKHRKFSVDLNGGPLGLPADFLIAPDGRVVAQKYGDHAYDQWSVDELIVLARKARD